MHVSVFVYVRVSIYVCMYVCMYVSMYVCTYKSNQSRFSPIVGKGSSGRNFAEADSGLAPDRWRYLFFSGLFGCKVGGNKW